MKKFSIALALVASLAFSGFASASIVISQADFTGMTVISSDGYTANTPSGAPTANPTFDDGDATMTGIAGVAGDLNVNAAAGAAEVFYGFSDLTAFTSGSDFVVTAFNDNLQNWDIGIWYAVGASVTESSASIIPGDYAAFTLTLPAGVSGAGVFVRSAANNDNFHASFTVPEATSFLIWGGLAMAGAITRRRRS